MAWISKGLGLTLSPAGARPTDGGDVRIMSSIHFKDVPAGDSWGSSIPFGGNAGSFSHKIMTAPKPLPHPSQGDGVGNQNGSLGNADGGKVRSSGFRVESVDLVTVDEAPPLSKAELRSLHSKTLSLLEVEPLRQKSESARSATATPKKARDEEAEELHELLWNSEVAPPPGAGSAESDESDKRVLASQVAALTKQLMQAGMKPHVTAAAAVVEEAERVIQVEQMLVAHAKLVRDQDEVIEQLQGRLEEAHRKFEEAQGRLEVTQGRLEEAQGRLEDHTLAERGGQAMSESRERKMIEGKEKELGAVRSRGEERERELLEGKEREMAEARRGGEEREAKLRNEIEARDSLIEKLDTALVNYERQLERLQEGNNRVQSPLAATTPGSGSSELRQSLYLAETQNAWLRGKMLKMGRRVQMPASLEEGGDEGGDDSFSPASAGRTEGGAPDRNTMMRRIAFRQSPKGGAISVMNVSGGGADGRQVSSVPGISSLPPAQQDEEPADELNATIRREVQLSLTEMSKNRSSYYSPGRYTPPKQARPLQQHGVRNSQAQAVSRIMPDVQMGDGNVMVTF